MLLKSTEVDVPTVHSGAAGNSDRPIPASVPISSLIALIAGSLILRLAAQTMGLMLLFYLEWINQNRYPLSHTTTGFVVASFFLAELLGSPILGALSDRYGRKLFIILGPLFGAVAVQMTAMTVVIWILVITRLLEGLSTASSIPATLGYISEATAGRPVLRARVVGLFEITLVGGIALGAAVSGFLWRSFSTPTTILGVELISPAFSINGLIYMVSLAIFAWGLKEARLRPSAARAGTAPTALGHYVRILKSRKVWKFVPAWLAINSILGIWINHTPRLMTGAERHGEQLLMGAYRSENFGLGYGVLAVVFAAGVLGWSFIMGRYRRTSVMMLATAGLFGTLLAVYGLNHASWPVLVFPLLAFLLICILVLSGFTPAALTYLADVTEEHKQDRGTIMGLYTVFLGIGQFVGTTTGGFFATLGGIDGLILLSTVFGLITGATLIDLRRQEAPAAS